MAAEDDKAPQQVHSTAPTEGTEISVETYEKDGLDTSQPFFGSHTRHHDEEGADREKNEYQDGSSDIEAQNDNLEVERIESRATNASRKTHRSVLSRISRLRSKTKEDVPPPLHPEMDLANGVVGWESQDDPAMPMNFPRSRKWMTVILLSTITFMTPFASSILAPAIQALGEEYNASSLTEASMPVSIFLLGYAVAPLFLSPLSEIYGRIIILNTASAFFCVWLIACSLAPSLGTLIFFRFMCGVGGSACQTIGGGVVADLFPVSERGRAMSIWMTGPILGPTIGPVIGGFATQNIGWRWVHWITFIPATITVIAMFFIFTETNHRILIKRKTEKLRKELDRPELRSCYVDPDVPPLTRKQVLLIGLIRPIKMLFTSAIIFSASLYIAFVYGCLYLLFNTIPIVFQGTYGWSIGTTGLVYLTLLVGYVFSMAVFSFVSDKTVVRMTAANGGVYEAEMRLPDSIWFALVLPIAFFWYGWAADKGTHWIVPVLGIVPFGIGSVGVWMPIQAYIVDAYPQYAASGLAAFAVLRCTVAAFLPLAGPKMYDSLGVGWGSSLLGFIAVALIPIPTLIYKYGKWMRERFPLVL